MKLNNKSILFVIIIFILLISTKSYILIHLKKFENESNSINNEYTPEILIRNLFNQYYAILNIGNPPQKTETHISVQDIGLSMEENICLTSNFYNKNKSLSLNQIHYQEIDKYYKKTVLVEETIDFHFYNTTTNILSFVTVPNYIFIYNKLNNTSEEGEVEKIEKEKDGKACAILGFELQCKIGTPYCKNIARVLKEKKITDTYNFNFIYYNDNDKKDNSYDASILIGENPHKYNKEKFNEKNYITTNSLTWIRDSKWILEFQNYYYLNNGTKISFGSNSLTETVKGLFNFNLDIIIGIKEYLRSIKTNYFDKYEKECSINLIENRYTVISCDKDFNIENFPTLYFYQSDYDYIFELTNKDLFQIRGNKKYFLIVFDDTSNFPWKFGKLFMQKYFFNFEADQKLIGFYKNLNDVNSNNNKTEIKNIFWVLIGSLILIVTGIGCFLLGKFLYDKNRKKRANELDDNYEYSEKYNKEPLNNDSNGNKLGIN